MESKTDNYNSSTEVTFEIGGEGKFFDIIAIKNTGLFFDIWKSSGEIELYYFVKEEKYPNLRNVNNLCIGLLGFYRWAQTDQGKEVVENHESTCGATNPKFYNTLKNLLDKSGDPDLFIYSADGLSSLAGIDVAKFVSLPPSNPLIGFLEKVEKRQQR